MMSRAYVLFTRPVRTAGDRAYAWLKGPSWKAPLAPMRTWKVPQRRMAKQQQKLRGEITKGIERQKKNDMKRVAE